MFKKIKKMFSGLFCEPECEHQWIISWERDYRRNMLEEKDWRSYSLNGEPTVQICMKCGTVEKHIDVPLEEYCWADRYIVNADWDTYLANKNKAD